MPIRILAFWLVLSIGSPLCCCSQPASSRAIETGAHAGCAKKQGHEQKTQGGGSDQCPHKLSHQQIAEIGVSLSSSAVTSVDMLPAWLNVIFSDVLRASMEQSHDAGRWRELDSRPESLSFCIRYHALLI